MDTPWIQFEQYQDDENRAGPDFSEYIWQALFACQVGIRSHQEWVKLKWGFNALALLEETLERQRLFLESQYAIRNELRMEPPDHRTLAFRFINRPGEGLVLTVLGKIHARTKEESIENALALYRELKSTFPYDYTLAPACSRDEFLQISGWDILENSESSSDLVQIKRSEIPILPERRSVFLQGFWQSNARAHEQIWRSLAVSLNPLLMNISLRSTILYPKELEKLSKSANDISEIDDHLVNEKTFLAMKHWHELYTERRLTPWKKFFYLQVHLASPGKIDENLLRIVGTSLTLGNDKQSLGYRVAAPRTDEQLGWRKKIRNLDVVSSASLLPIPRLAEVADLDEVFAVVRFPYSPPEDGFPDMKFAAAKNDEES
ncbi:MAG: hypothetical protein EHM33_18610 [Chloroflexi bacterium]|nr:MAG: hypothetical protein EHM33_18610 [Chloroflexota bacterium]